MKHHSPWLDLPAIPVLSFFGCLLWPGSTFGLPFVAWTLEEFVGTAFSIACFAGGLWLTVVPYASASLQALDVERGASVQIGTLPAAGRSANTTEVPWIPNARRSSLHVRIHNVGNAVVAPCRNSEARRINDIAIRPADSLSATPG